MIRWLIASYIVIVLVLSAKAGAKFAISSGSGVNKLTYQDSASQN